MTELKRKVTLKRKEVTPKKSNLKWWLLLIPLLVVIVGAVYFLTKDSGSADSANYAPDSRKIEVEQTNTMGSEMQVDGITATEEAKIAKEKITAENEVTTAEPTEEPAKTVTPASTPANEPVITAAQSSQPTAKPAASNTPASTLPQGTIEGKAKQVIRGDFGNGADRKQALGSEYDAIQRKVNEMYRNGEVSN